MNTSGPVQPEVGDPSLVIDPGKVLDISAFLQGDRLVWKAPAGEWTILRTGMLPTGVTNSPADPEATGLEIDKMSRKHVEAHFEAFMGEIYRRIPAEDRACWKVVVQDSYETADKTLPTISCRNSRRVTVMTRYRSFPLMKDMWSGARIVPTVSFGICAV